MTPTFQGEVQFRRYSDTSTQGQQIVLAVADREALEAFIGKEGRRFIAVLVEVGDDEMPVEPAKPRDQRGPLCREACDLCDMREFQLWAAMVGGYAVTSSANAKEYITMVCDIESRKHLDEIPSAADRFVSNIRIPFMRWQRERKAA